MECIFFRQKVDANDSKIDLCENCKRAWWEVEAARQAPSNWKDDHRHSNGVPWLATDGRADDTRHRQYKRRRLPLLSWKIRQLKEDKNTVFAKHAEDKLQVILYIRMWELGLAWLMWILQGQEEKAEASALIPTRLLLRRLPEIEDNVSIRHALHVG